jgi:hypothetical protein
MTVTTRLATLGGLAPAATALFTAAASASTSAAQPTAAVFVQTAAAGGEGIAAS